MKLKYPYLIFALGFLILLGLNGKSQVLYVGANYHPHDDKNPEKIHQDIQLMKAAGLNVVRMGHLAWDSYEPSEGKFDFKWFDTVMDMMNEAVLELFSISPFGLPLSGCTRNTLQ